LCFEVKKKTEEQMEVAARKKVKRKSKGPSGSAAQSSMKREDVMVMRKVTDKSSIPPKLCLLCVLCLREDRPKSR